MDGAAGVSADTTDGIDARATCAAGCPNERRGGLTVRIITWKGTRSGEGGIGIAAVPGQSAEAVAAVAANGALIVLGVAMVDGGEFVQDH